MKQALVAQENTRLVMLEDCERKIGGFMRRGVEATIGIGQQLAKINQLELYKEKGYELLNAYCLEELQLEARSVGRFMAIADSAKVLKDANMELPAMETHVAELSRIDAAEQPMIWERLQKVSAEREVPITAEMVRDAVNYRLKELKEEEARAAATSPKERAKTSLEEPDLDLGADLSKDKSERSSASLEVPTRISLSEEGEEALEKIRRVCGEQIGEAIEHLRLPISERELINWADDPEPTNLSYYVVELRWSVSKAQGFIHQTVTERTPVGRLITMAMASEGRFETELEGGIKITVEQLARKAA